MSAGRYLNIGCGGSFHPSWYNLDLVSSSPHVRAHDLRNGLPFPAASFEACYHSHVLEHMTPAQGRSLIAECHRVLAPGGILRVVVPDLEGIAREYLAALERSAGGDISAEADHAWMALELLDQTVRPASGGEMAGYLEDPAIPNREFVRSRLGVEAEAFWEGERGRPARSLWHRMRSKGMGWWVTSVRRGLAAGLVRVVAGPTALAAFREGLFRHSGEVHRCMYDRLSLGRLLERAGFSEVRVCRPDESRIPQFNRYHLDVVGGKVRKPDSLFMEGVRV
jgi:hypothetical protein